LLNLEKTSRSKEVAFVQEIHVTGSQNPVPQRNVTDGPYSKNVRAYCQHAIVFFLF